EARARPRGQQARADRHRGSGGGEGRWQVSDAAEILVVDLRAEECVLRRDQWSPHLRRDPAKFRGVVLHQWASHVGTEARLRAKHGGEAQALARRGPHAPYTISAGVTLVTGEPVVSLAHPRERYTYASDSASAEFVSVGIMGRFPFEEEDRSEPRDTALTPALFAAVNRALSEALAMLPGGGPWPLITHRQSINGPRDHVLCPGEASIILALASSAVRDGLLVPDPDMLVLPEWGKAWPASWRRHLAVARPDVADASA